MKRHCACGKSWEGEGACPACALLAAAKGQELDQKLEHLRRGFAALIKIAANTPTAAKKPPRLGPLASAAWRIRQLGKERVEGLKRLADAKRAFERICEIEPDEKPDGTILGYLVHDADEMSTIAHQAAIDLYGSPNVPGSWPWACEQLARGLMIRRESDTGAAKYRLDKENQGRICWTFTRVPGKKDWETANLFLADFEATNWAVWP